VPVTWLRRANVVDVQSGQVRRNCSIGIQDGLIARIEEGGPPALLDGVELRGDGLRISPHFFNTEADIDRCFGELASLM